MILQLLTLFCRSSATLFQFILITDCQSTVGDGAFPFAAAHVWNSLPDLVTSAPSLAAFCFRSKPTCLTFPTLSLCDRTVPAQ